MPFDWLLNDPAERVLRVRFEAESDSGATAAALVIARALVPIVLAGVPLGAGLEAASTLECLGGLVGDAIARGREVLPSPLAAGSLQAALERAPRGPRDVAWFWNEWLFVPGPLYMATERITRQALSRADLVRVVSEAIVSGRP